MNRKRLLDIIIGSGIVILLLLLVFCYTNIAHAAPKPVVLEIEFELDDTAADLVTEYQLHVEKVPGSAVIELIATMPVTDTTSRVVTTEEMIDIPYGKDLAYYLYAVYQDGGVGYSPASLFKIVGKPFIIRINRVN